MKRIEFRLTMPNRGSWNGGWSGSENNYTITRRLTEKKIEELGIGKDGKSWYHAWGDGWGANVHARIVPVGERLKKSAGFAGYDWMVDNIIPYNSTRVPEEVTK